MPTPSKRHFEGDELPLSQRRRFDPQLVDHRDLVSDPDVPERIFQGAWFNLISSTLRVVTEKVERMFTGYIWHTGVSNEKLDEIRTQIFRQSHKVGEPC